MPDHLAARIASDVDALAGRALPGAAGVRLSAGEVRRAAASAVPAVLEDLDALAARDTAARGGREYAYASYLTFQALVAYRVAHAIYRIADASAPEACAGVRIAARRISEDAKVRTGVDIHPAALIGRRMVIDHGWGTVIGEQAQVGDDCYFLQNVTLGCRRIGWAYGSGQRRHPTVGDRVLIAGDVWIFGPVKIGDDCRIDPGARIACDIPAGAHVRVVTKLQVTQAVGPLTAASLGDQ
jgi:serine O-acetyltransferase